MGKVPAPQIIWKGAHPGNYTVGRPNGGRNGQETFHHVVGSADSAVLVFNTPGRQGSAHFIVTDKPGVIYQCVNINDTAWADSNWASNLRSISVEHHGDWRNGYNNPTVRENAALLCAWLRDQGLISHAVRHRQVATNGTICPADLPVESIWNRATEIIAQYNKPAEQPEYIKNRKAISKTVYAQIEGLRLINLNNPSAYADARVFARNTSFELGSETTVGGVKYYITKSSTDTNAPNGIRASEVADTPWVAPTQPVPPKPTTPAWADSLLKDIPNTKMYVLRATPLIDLENGHPYVDPSTNKEVWFNAGDVINDVSAQTIVSEKTYMLTEYGFQKVKGGEYQKFGNGILANDLSLNPLSTPPGTPANPKDDEQDGRLSKIEGFIDALLEALAKVFSGEFLKSLIDKWRK